MTQQQFEHIQGLLEEWRAVRNLSVEDQKKNFKVNYTKELLEFFEAERDGNEYEMIDALCDMIVVAINAGIRMNNSLMYYDVPAMDGDLVGVFAVIPTIDLLIAHIYNRGYDPYKCLLETIKELNSRSGSWSDKEGKWVKGLGAYTLDEALQNCLLGIRDKDFEVRTDGDFFIVTDTHRNEEYSFKKWYKADYSKCKL